MIVVTREPRPHHYCSDDSSWDIQRLREERTGGWVGGRGVTIPDRWEETYTMKCVGLEEKASL